MKYINPIIRVFFSYRKKAIDNFKRFPHEVHYQQFKRLMNIGDAPYLNSFGVNKHSSYDEFRSRVPIVIYEEFAQWIDLEKAGKKCMLTKDQTRWFAKSSGTTNDTSKYIPVNRSSLTKCHYMGPKDLLITSVENYPKTKAYTGKALILGGSQQVVTEGSGLKVGDLSAILIDNSPAITQMLKEPKKSVALTPDFEQKIEIICRTCTSKNITYFAGVPSWNLILMKRILEYTGKNNLLEVWPDLSLFVHGGISFTPYRSEFERLIPSEDMIYIETYNASEGFFAMQDDPTDSSMLLMLDYGTFYEFIPISTLDDHSTAIPLEGVKLGVNYAMIISTLGGLWRYIIGDTVMFTSTTPYRIIITGRTKQFINAFGEELMVDNAERALKSACQQTGCSAVEYTVAPIFMRDESKGSHQWLIEFLSMPSDLEDFAKILDLEIQHRNSDYQAKRTNNATMQRLTLNVAPAGTFKTWMQHRGRLGGQNKVPRLSPERKYIEELLEMISKS